MPDDLGDGAGKLLMNYTPVKSRRSGIDHVLVDAFFSFALCIFRFISPTAWGTAGFFG